MLKVDLYMTIGLWVYAKHDDNDDNEEEKEEEIREKED